jgi:hypothetical protein
LKKGWHRALDFNNQGMLRMSHWLSNVESVPAISGIPYAAGSFHHVAGVVIGSR